MIELERDTLVVSFPEVHREARLTVSFQRTLRIPDDGRRWPLPPGLGRFPLAHVDDHAERLPGAWLRRGGVMMPMYQSEALWLSFSGQYPFAVKVATGKIDAVTGREWSESLEEEPQNYLVCPGQPWLDGYCVEKGVIRQFVAMPLGAGVTAEEQLTGKAEHGGIQLLARPMKAEAYERMRTPTRLDADWGVMRETSVKSFDMGLAPGGTMNQDVYEDPYGPDAWDPRASRCFVHIANSLQWRAITGAEPPTTPLTAEEYARRGLPWFDYYDDDLAAVEGSDLLTGLTPVGGDAKAAGRAEGSDARPGPVVRLGKRSSDVVREGRF